MSAWPSEVHRIGSSADVAPGTGSINFTVTMRWINWSAAMEAAPDAASLNLAGSPPANGMTAILAGELGEDHHQQATSAPSGETTGQVDCSFVTCTGSPPSIDALHMVALPETTDV